MCVHVLCGCALPDDAVVWVDPTGDHVLVYVDPRLTVEGALTEAGIGQVNAALSHVPGAPSLEAAVSCR